MQKIIPHLWFENQAKEAVDFYTSVFNNSKTGDVACYDNSSSEVSGQPSGSVMTIEFEIESMQFLGLNGGPHFKFTPAISFFVNCSSEDEVDEFWNKLSEDGKALMPLDTYPFSKKYGWIQDKYGTSWQVILSEEDFDQKIVPSLLFVGENAGKAEEAINFYTKIFKDAKVGDIARYGANQEPDKEGTVAFADFTLEGQKFAAMDSAHKHDFTFNEAVSLMVNCKDQEEVDYFWEKLSADPNAEQCGWLKDKYGVSWQIVPVELPKLLSDPDPEKSGRVMKEMLQMKKIDINKLKQVYENKN